MRLVTLPILLITSFLSASSVIQGQTMSATSAPEISASEIVTKMAYMNEKRAAALKGFTSHRTYVLDYSGFPSRKHAKMEVDVTFNAPKKELKIVSEEGAEMLRDHVLHKLVESEAEANDRSNKTATALTEANYEFTFAGREQKDGRNCYLLEVKPRNKSKFLYEGKVWVDATEFAVVHIQAQPAKNPSFWVKRTDIEHRYEKVGSFWLPVSNRSTSSTRTGGHAVLAIDYSGYHVVPHEPASPQQNALMGSSQ
jgi:hypothetical protein